MADRSQGNLRTGIGLFALFALTFAAVAVPLSLLLRARAPAPHMIVLSQKLEIYGEMPQAFDTIFVGTSRTYYHIVPDAVEDAAEATGCDRPSVFNFGIFGLTGAEQSWLIAEIQRLGRDKLSRLVFEHALPEARTFARATDIRSRYFHGPEHYAAIAENISSMPETAPKRLFRSGIAMLGIGYDLSGVGRASEALFPSLAELDDDTAPFRRERGFAALDEEIAPDIIQRGKAFSADPAAFPRLITKRANMDLPNTTARASYLGEQADTLTNSGIRSGIWFPPNLLDEDPHRRLAAAIQEASPATTVLDYSRPEAYPNLFNQSLWFDDAHLGREGATLLSAEVGKDLCLSGFLDKDAG
ncbi:MAG: hypothetical protein AAF292_08205 [Pseudomonadota bacterium]